MNVLSLFDGISGGQQALDRLGVKVGLYCASEVDKYAIQITQNNYPDTVQLGDVCGVGAYGMPKIDLLLAGSPCQGFSFAGKQLAFDDPRSKLFFEFVRTLKELREVNPEIKFLLENVKMKKEYQDVITGLLGVEPIEINSALVSAQNRRRLYWTNIVGVQQPVDRGIYLKDIVLPDVIPVELDGLRGKNGCFGEGYARVFTEKSTTLRTPSGGGNIPSFVRAGMLDEVKALTFTEARSEESKQIRKEIMKSTGKDFSPRRGKVVVPRPDHKSNCLTASMTIEHLVLTDKALAYMDRKVKDGRSHWDFKHHSDIRDPKSAAIVANFFKGVPYNVFKDWDCVRKFHPIECERLQTVKDNYTEGVSNTQRYKALGNGWTIDVIAHILWYANFN